MNQRSRVITTSVALVLLASPVGAHGATPLTQCAPDAVVSGTVCTDTYEASVRRVPDSAGANRGLVKKIQQGRIKDVTALTDAGATKLGVASDHHAPCADSGKNCGDDIHALSLPAEESRALEAAGGRPRAQIEAGAPGVAAEYKSHHRRPSKLLVALPLINREKTAVSSVELTHVRLRRERLVRPAKLPLSLGDIAAGGEAVAQFAFTSRGMPPDEGYVLNVRGLANVGGVRMRFEVEVKFEPPLPARGVRRPREVAIGRHRVDGPFLPPAKPPLDLENINEDKSPPLPVGKLIGKLAPDNPAVRIGGFRPPRALNPLAPNDPVSYVRVGTSDLTDADTKNGFPQDPSGASADVRDVAGKIVPMVFLSGNLYGLLSVDGGASYTHVDPTTILNDIPSDGLPQDLGLCCDGNLIYVPSIDRWIWMLLTKGSVVGTDAEGNPYNGFNRLRVAFASSAEVLASHGTSWSYWDMTTASFGLDGEAPFLDYPDITFTDKFLYMSVTVYPDFGFLVARVPLADLQGGPTIHIGYTDPRLSSRSYQARLTHDVADGAYWFGHATNSAIIVYEWLDGSDSYSWTILEIDSWNDKAEDFVSKTPDGTNWIAADTTAVRGATYQGLTAPFGVPVRTFIGAWNAAPGGDFPQAYVRLLTLLEIVPGSSMYWYVLANNEIWNPDFAFHHAHLATNSNQEIGVSVAAGGGGSEASATSGFLGDTALYVVNVSQKSYDRWGDYTTIRPHCPDPRFFSVSDYFIDKAGRVVHQYSMFGRTADAPGP